jgi:signal transduction histidine kinase
MLYEFLRDHRETILAGSRERIRSEAGLQITDAELAEGVPVFLDQLVHVLRREDGATSEEGRSAAGDRSAMDESAARYGETLLRVGFTISQVVRGYGAVCQTVTGLLDELKIPVSAREYETLNRCLDDAIAEAVTSYEALTDRGVAAREVEHLGSLAHELRNSLAVAMSTVHLLKQRVIGFSGRAPTTLERALARMRDLIDRSLAEVRSRAKLPPAWESIRLAEVFEYVSTTAGCDAEARALDITWDVEPSLVIEADRQLLISAVTNLVQNALKYSRRGGTVAIRARRAGECVVIEVEDACGGLPEGAVGRIFDAYAQAGADRSGLGLGLPIVARSVKAHDGELRVHNLPNKGCIFEISLPESRGAECAVAETADLGG